MENKFQGYAKQDEFAANMLNFKKGGYYLDIGSSFSKLSNNSYYFDENLDWSGICIENSGAYRDEYKDRKKCTLILQDALGVDYKKVFAENNFPKDVDFLSLDVDTLSLSVLHKLPLDEYKFKVIAIEHDAYLYGDKYRAPQRDVLIKNGYVLICSNVYVEQIEFDRKECAFEDWYVHPDFFDKDIIEKISSENEYPSNIIAKF